MLKRFCNKAIAVGMVVSASVLVIPTFASAYSHQFSDVKKEKSHYKTIMELTEAGIINGYNNGTFGINDDLQRRHGAVLLYNALGLTTPNNVEDILDKYYDDVNMDNEYAGQIAAVTPNIFKGNNSSFNPTADLTREQMATTIVKAFGLQDKGTNPGINLSNVSASHKNNVKILAQYYITNQYDDFRPSEIVTRGQFATFLYNALHKDELEPEEPEQSEKPETEYRTTSYNIDFQKAIDQQKNQKVDGTGNFTASRELIKYYANPNNFSKGSPEFFQFLLLSYTPGLNADEINKKVLNGKGSLEGKAKTFIEAGKKFNVNPLYLMAHALHETGNGTSKLSTGYSVSKVDGKKVTEKKTYNMYGIKAYDSCPLQCGSEHAYKQKWFTVDAAITGGAKYITNDYIGRGQDTLYKMRWNPDSPGFPQYATHVEWAAIQARKIHDMYEIYNLLDTPGLTFEIPKYKNQPGASSKPTGEAKYAIDTSSKGTKGQTTDNLNLRIAPSTAYTSIKLLSKGTMVEILGENGGWYKVKADGKTGWVSGDYIKPPFLLKVINVSSSLYIRSKPTNESDPVGSVHNNDEVTGVVDENGNFIIKDGYYKVLFRDKEAWIHGDYLKEK
ncbi:SH3 domain-containing protein [Lentibacillus sp. Marseille-P4043]|uniref:SH3 domain-containing protein n=1 Tax=Lentibacillus sp. Marseille-P4043 TaxID=2040293 RepID=UPI000D0B4A43|nr:SH3 domain-containing protein [Lentibacillus sp. Marseille-P4043]